MSNLTLAEVKRTITEGRTFDVTNHYVTRPGHPLAQGELRRTVERANTTGFYLSLDGVEGGSFVPWPKAADVERSDDGAILFYGGGVAQGDADLFLTIREVPETVDATVEVEVEQQAEAGTRTVAHTVQLTGVPLVDGELDTGSVLGDQVEAYLDRAGIPAAARTWHLA